MTMDGDIEMLQALHGDAFILHCRKDNHEGIIVVDGGPDKDSYKIVDKLDTLGYIDLMVLTHYDDDHIGGILAYIKKHRNDKPFPVKEMWLNCVYEIPFVSSPNISFRQAKMLADELTQINRELEANGMPLIKWKEDILYDHSIRYFPFADILILSPDADTKALNVDNYLDDILAANIGRGHVVQKAALQMSLDELAQIKKTLPPKTKSAIVNKSSIAFVVRCENFSALMLGDSYPDTIIDSLKSLGFTAEKPIKVDFLKVSHHGSRFNISNELLDMIDCSNYLVSTNGGSGRSCHPDRETIANIVCHNKHRGEVNLFFNYPLKQIESRGYKFLKDGEQIEYAFNIYDDVQLITKR